MEETPPKSAPDDPGDAGGGVHSESGGTRGDRNGAVDKTYAPRRGGGQEAVCAGDAESHRGF